MKVKYLFVVGVLLLLTGCTGTKQTEKDAYNIVTSFYPIYVFTKNVTKDIPNVEVSNMAEKHVGCLHDYQLSTANMKKIEGCDLFITNGIEEEPFVSSALKNRPGLAVIKASAGIELIDSKFEDEANEHIWLSITAAEKMVDNIEKALIKNNPENKKAYEKNAKEYKERLENLKTELEKELSGLENINIVTTHDAFPYFAKEFGITIFDVVERAYGESPTPKEMQELISNIKKNNIKGIFIEPNYSDKLAQTIAKETGAKVYTLDSITSGKDEFTGYEDAMRKNVEVIKSSL